MLQTSLAVFSNPNSSWNLSMSPTARITRSHPTLLQGSGFSADSRASAIPRVHPVKASSSSPASAVLKRPIAAQNGATVPSDWSFKRSSLNHAHLRFAAACNTLKASAWRSSACSAWRVNDSPKSCCKSEMCQAEVDF